MQFLRARCAPHAAIAPADKIGGGRTRIRGGVSEHRFHRLHEGSKTHDSGEHHAFADRAFEPESRTLRNAERMKIRGRRPPAGRHLARPGPRCITALERSRNPSYGPWLAGKSAASIRAVFQPNSTRPA